MSKNTSNLCDYRITNQSLLSHLVRSHQLTECLDWIEQNVGLTGDPAIFVIALVNEGGQY